MLTIRGFLTMLLPFLVACISSAQSSQALRSDSLRTFVCPETWPDFPGDFNQWKSGNLVYPQIARDSGWEGRTIIQFRIRRSGKVAAPKIVRSSGYAVLDREALRFVSAMPRWKFSGKRVETLYTLPINFKLE